MSLSLPTKICYSYLSHYAFAILFVLGTSDVLFAQSNHPCTPTGKPGVSITFSSGNNSPMRAQVENFVREQKFANHEFCEKSAGEIKNLYHTAGYKYGGEVNCTTKTHAENNTCNASVHVFEYEIKSLRENDREISEAFRQALNLTEGQLLDTIALESSLKKFYESAEFRERYTRIEATPYFLPDKTILLSFRTHVKTRTRLTIYSGDGYKDGFRSGLSVENPNLHLGADTILRDRLYTVNSDAHVNLLTQHDNTSYLKFSLQSETFFRDRNFTDTHAGAYFMPFIFKLAGASIQTGPGIFHLQRNQHDQTFSPSADNLCYGVSLLSDQRRQLLEPRLGNYFSARVAVRHDNQIRHFADFEAAYWSRISGGYWLHLNAEGATGFPTGGKFITGESISWPEFQSADYARVSVSLLHDFRALLAGPALEYLTLNRYGSAGVSVRYFGEATTLRFFAGGRLTEIFSGQDETLEFTARLRASVTL